MVHLGHYKGLIARFLSRVICRDSGHSHWKSANSRLMTTGSWPTSSALSFRITTGHRKSGGVKMRDSTNRRYNLKKNQRKKRRDRKPREFMRVKTIHR